MNNQPTPETKSFYVTAFDVEEWAEKCIRLEKERDDALSQIAQAECRAERYCQERDEARSLLKSAQSALDAIHLEVGGWIKTMKENSD